MKSERHSSLQTRPSLLKRLQTGDDPLSWKEFYATYGGLIRHFATRSGLNDDEAEEVIQETAIGVASRLPYFVYDPKSCRFKSWLLNLTRWRIARQLRRRRQPGSSMRQASEDEAGGVSCDVPDETLPEFGAEWDAEWQKNLFKHGLEIMREKLDERHYQAFDLAVLKGWAPADVARTLNISTARVYLIKHRVSALLKTEVRRLEQRLEHRMGPRRN